MKYDHEENDPEMAGVVDIEEDSAWVQHLLIPARCSQLLQKLIFTDSTQWVFQCQRTSMIAHPENIKGELNMRVIRILAVLSLVMLTATACHHRKSKTLCEKDVTAIHEIASAFEKALLAGDWEAWANLYSEDAKYMRPNAPIIEGRAAILEMTKGGKPFPEASVKIVQLEGKWKTAVARGTYSYAMAEQAEGMSMTDTGKFVWLLKRKKQEGDDDKKGKWEIAIECYNSDLPLPKQ